MRIVCPDCAAVFDLTVALNEADARRFLDLLKDVPPSLVGPLMRYLRLHKPKKSSLRWSRMLRLLGELLPMIKEARVERNGSRWVAPVELWARVMNEMVEQPPAPLRLPLKGNGYLLSVLAAQAEQMAANEERSVEEQRRHRIDSREGMRSLREMLGSTTLRKNRNEGR